MQIPATDAPDPVWDFIVDPPDLALPDFSACTPERLLAACARVEESTRTSVAALRSCAPEFRSLTVGLERALLPARGLSALMRVLTSNVLTDDIAEADAEISSRLTSLHLEVLLDAELFARLEEVSVEGLIPEDRRLHEETLRGFIRAGARLSGEDRQLAADLASEIARLETEFTRRLVAGAAAADFRVSDLSELAGLSPDALDRAAALAAERAESDAAAGLEPCAGIVPLLSTTQQPALDALTDPRTRARLLEASMSRGIGGGDLDVRELISDLTALRALLAEKLGFRSYAAYIADDQVAGDDETAGSLLEKLIGPAGEQFARERAAVVGEAPVEPADVAHLWHAHAARELSLDDAEVSAHLEFERTLVDGVFYTAEVLYGLTFAARDDLRGWHEDVRVYEARDAGRPLGLVCIDPYARPTKGGGAWMDELVTGARLTGSRPVVTLTLNLPKPAPGRPTLLSADELITLFHEFGHVVHGLVADSTYPSMAGTSVPRDYVEFPSQLHETWATHPQVLPRYAVHVETGEPMPTELAERLRAAGGFGQGFGTLEYLAAAMLDLGWHALAPGEHVSDVLTFEAELLAAAGFDPLVPPRYRSTYFKHVFSGGYAAGYYSYLWSEQYAAYVSEWFDDRGGLDPEAGREFRRAILAPGGSIAPTEAFAAFFGELPDAEPLMRRRGLAPARPAGPVRPEHAKVERDLAAVGSSARVRVFDDHLPTAKAAAEHLGIDVAAIANSLIFMADEEPILVMTSGAHRVDTAFLAESIGAETVRRAKPEEVLAATGQVIGGVAPCGHPALVRTYVDRTLAGHGELWAGGGTPEAMIPLDYPTLLRVTNGTETDIAPR